MNAVAGGGSDRLIEGMEKIASNRERVLSTMIVAECAARRSSRYRCQVDEHVQYIPMLQKVSGRVILV
jgi:hypothetical protein